VLNRLQCKNKSGIEAGRYVVLIWGTTQAVNCELSIQYYVIHKYYINEYKRLYYNYKIVEKIKKYLILEQFIAR